MRVSPRPVNCDHPGGWLTPISARFKVLNPRFRMSNGVVRITLTNHRVEVVSSITPMRPSAPQTEAQFIGVKAVAVR